MRPVPRPNASFLKPGPGPAGPSCPYAFSSRGAVTEVSSTCRTSHPPEEDQPLLSSVSSPSRATISTTEFTCNIVVAPKRKRGHVTGAPASSCPPPAPGPGPSCIHVLRVCIPDVADTRSRAADGLLQRAFHGCAVARVCASRRRAQRPPPNPQPRSLRMMDVCAVATCGRLCRMPRFVFT